jgi:hypothetical protein
MGVDPRYCLSERTLSYHRSRRVPSFLRRPCGGLKPRKWRSRKARIRRPAERTCRRSHDLTGTRPDLTSPGPFAEDPAISPKPQGPARNLGRVSRRGPCRTGLFNLSTDSTPQLPQLHNCLNSTTASTPQLPQLLNRLNSPTCQPTMGRQAARFVDRRSNSRDNYSTTFFKLSSGTRSKNRCSGSIAA